MMEIKWIKLDVGLFDNRKIKQIESMDDGDALIAIWLKILLLAGRINDSGYVYFTKGIPYTTALLSTQWNKSEELIDLALNTFEEFEMIEVDKEGFIRVLNWNKYQNVESLDRIREQTRERVARHRELKKIQPEIAEKPIEHIKEEKKEKASKKPIKVSQLEMLGDLFRDNEYNLSQPLKDALTGWIEYKAQIKKPYVESGMNQMLKKCAKYEEKYGTTAVIQLIEDCMASGYQGLVWDKLDRKPNNYQRKSMLNDLADFVNGG